MRETPETAVSLGIVRACVLNAGQYLLAHVQSGDAK